MKTIFSKKGNPLQLSQVKEGDRVWVEVNSEDAGCPWFRKLYEKGQRVFEVEYLSPFGIFFEGEGNPFIASSWFDEGVAQFYSVVEIAEKED